MTTRAVALRVANKLTPSVRHSHYIIKLAQTCSVEEVYCALTCQWCTGPNDRPRCACHTPLSGFWLQAPEHWREKIIRKAERVLASPTLWQWSEHPLSGAVSPDDLPW